jgi:hypothetical protein
MRRTLIALLLAAIASGCGGGEVAPGPLRFTLEDKHLAAIPVAEKQPVVAAKQEYDVAQMNCDKNVSDLDESKLEITKAKNEVEQRILDEKSARAERQKAQSGADQTRRNNAERDARTAELGRRAADGKLAYMKAKKKYGDAMVRFCQRDIYAKQSKLELEKARIANAKDIRPTGFDFAAFDKQYNQRTQEAQKARAKAEQESKKAEEKRVAWDKLEQEYMGARGVDQAKDTTGANTTPPPPLPTTPDPATAPVTP